MAQSKELQLKEGYQDPAQQIAYNPLQVADASGTMKENRSVALQNMQREDQMLTKGEDAVLEWAKNNDTQKLADLTTFSASLQEVTKLGVKEYWKNQELVGIAAARDNGVPFQEYLQWNQSRAQLQNGEVATDALKAQDLADGVPFEVAHMWKNLSPIAKLAAQEQMAKQAAGIYPSYLKERFQDNTTQIRGKDINGNEVAFTPAEAANDPVLAAQAVAYWDRNFYEQYGFIGVNKSLLQKHAFEKMNEARTRIIGEARNGFAQNKSAETVEQVRNAILDGGNMLDAIRTLQTTVDKDGNPLNRTTARALYFKLLTEIDSAGMLEESTLQALMDQQFSENISVGKQWELDFNTFKKARAARAIQAGQQDEAALAQLARDGEKILEEAYGNDPASFTDAFIRQAKIEYFQKYRVNSSFLDKLETTYSVTQQQKDELNRQFTKDAESNMLFVENVEQAPWDVRQKWIGIAVEQQKGRTTEGRFKTHLDAIKNTVLSDPRVRVSPNNGATSGVTTLVINELQAKFNKRVAALIGIGTNASEAATVASGEMMAEFKNNPRYAINGLGEFSNFSLGSAKTTQALNAKLNRIQKSLVDGGKASLNKIPGLIFNSSQLKAIEQGYGQPGWQLPDEALYWGATLRISPLEVINRQRQAAGMQSLAAPTSLDVIETSISPQMRALLNRLPSYNHSVRALGSAGRFIVDAVPKGYGPIIQQAAKKYGVDPSVLAGMLEKESSWRDDIISGRTKSEVGATGIAQFMPATAREQGVDPLNVESSINGAAKYLATLTKQYGGVNAAMAAYAGYGGNAQDPGFIKNYLTPVLKSAAKYGYGQAWNDPALMRPSVVYKIGSLGYGSTGPHLDLKRVDPKTNRTAGTSPIGKTEVDNYVQVNIDGKWKPLSQGTGISDGEAAHRKRNSYGIDYTAPSGTPVRLTNGARVVDTFKGDGGTDHLIVELPDGRRFQFLHGTKV